MTEDEMVDGITNSISCWMVDGITNTSLSKLWELVMDREAWHASMPPWHGVHGVAKSWTLLNDCTELIFSEVYYY